MLDPDFNQLVPVSIDHTTLPITQGFIWDACFDINQTGEWYLVVFRSVLKSHYDEVKLNDADKRALADATSSPGFVHYFCGSPSSNGQCLSLCIWNSQREAREASKSPAHREAMALVKESYDYYKIELYRIIKKSGLITPEIVPYQ